MTYLLAGDIGGTKTILRLVETNDESQAPVKLKTLYEERYTSAEYPDLVPIVEKFLGEAAETLGSKPIPEKACFAIAGPIVNNTVKLTNLSWMLNASEMESALGISQIRLINDFEAIGYGVLGLTDEDLEVLQTGETKPEAPIAVLGAGTGLGECFLVGRGNAVKVYPTEGGHTDFAPRSELEFQLFQYLLEKHGIDRVSVERVVSGLGIVSIYQFLRDRNSAPETPEIAEAVRTWEKEVGLSERSVDPAAFIGKAALEKSDRFSEKTMQIFVEAYGAEAGNLALKTLCFGGLYVAGGIAGKILPLLKDGDFMEAFTNKGRMSGLLKKMPVRIITNPQVGLIGAAIRAANL